MRESTRPDQTGPARRPSLTAAVVAVVLAVTSGVVGSAPVAAQEAVTIGIDDSYPPYMYANDGQPAGLYYDLILAVFKRMDAPVTIEAMPWTLAVERTDKAETGLGGLYKNDARLEKYDYSDAILDEKLVVFVRSGDEFAFDKLEDLQGRVIGVNSGWSYGQEFDAARASGVITAEEGRSDTDNMLKLLAGEINAAIVNSLAADIIIAKHDEAKEAVVALPKPVATNKGYLAFNKESDKQSLLEYFDYILSEMQADGGFDSIFLDSAQKNAIVVTD